MLDCHTLEALMWIDTRDMASDGLTKGKVERDLIHMVMNGLHKLKYAQDAKIWSSKLRLSPKRLLEEAEC